MDGSFQYKWAVFRVKILMSKPLSWIRKLSLDIEMNWVKKRLERKGYSKIRVIIIMSRYMKFQQHIAKMGSKEAFRNVYQMIVEISEITGVPQWELRTMLQKDFNMDV